MTAKDHEIGSTGGVVMNDVAGGLLHRRGIAHVHSLVGGQGQFGMGPDVEYVAVPGTRAYPANRDVHRAGWLLGSLRSPAHLSRVGL